MPNREDKRYIKTPGVALCPFCGTRDVAFDEILRDWHCSNKQCNKHFPQPSWGPGGPPPKPEEMAEREKQSSSETATETTTQPSTPAPEESSNKEVGASRGLEFTSCPNCHQISMNTNPYGVLECLNCGSKFPKADPSTPQLPKAPSSQPRTERDNFPLPEAKKVPDMDHRRRDIYRTPGGYVCPNCGSNAIRVERRLLRTDFRCEVCETTFNSHRHNFRLPSIGSYFRRVTRFLSIRVWLFRLAMTALALYGFFAIIHFSNSFSVEESLSMGINDYRMAVHCPMKPKAIWKFVDRNPLEAIDYGMAKAAGEDWAGHACSK